MELRKDSEGTNGRGVVVVGDDLTFDKMTRFRVVLNSQTTVVSANFQGAQASLGRIRTGRQSAWNDWICSSITSIACRKARSARHACVAARAPPCCSREVRGCPRLRDRHSLQAVICNTRCPPAHSLSTFMISFTRPPLTNQSQIKTHDLHRQYVNVNNAAFTFENLWVVIECEKDFTATHNMQHIMPTRAVRRLAWLLQPSGLCC